MGIPPTAAAAAPAETQAAQPNTEAWTGAQANAQAGDQAAQMIQQGASVLGSIMLQPLLSSMQAGQDDGTS